jgi:TRAP-type mannitol/chloroaromatic compound transport system permease small subunit
MLIILSLIEIHAIYSSNNQKIGYLLGFIGALYFILPLILGGLFDNDYLMMFSPFGLLMDYEMYNDLADLIPVFIVNIILLLPLFLLIVSRYSAISKLRSRIEASH